jgi:hypothetical protein
MPCKSAEQSLETREPSCVPRVARPFFIPVVHSRRGPWNTWQHRSSPLRKAEPRAMGHVTAPELPSQEGRTRGHGTRDSTRAHLVKEARSGTEGHVAASELTSARRRGPGPRDTWCEGPRRQPEGGWMGANKNSPIELGLYPKSQPKPLSSSSAKTA